MIYDENGYITIENRIINIGGYAVLLPYSVINESSYKESQKELMDAMNDIKSIDTDLKKLPKKAKGVFLARKMESLLGWISGITGVGSGVGSVIAAKAYETNKLKSPKRVVIAILSAVVACALTMVSRKIIKSCDKSQVKKMSDAIDKSIKKFNDIINSPDSDASIVTSAKRNIAKLQNAKNLINTYSFTNSGGIPIEDIDPGKYQYNDDVEILIDSAVNYNDHYDQYSKFIRTIMNKSNKILTTVGEKCMWSGCKFIKCELRSIEFKYKDNNLFSAEIMGIVNFLEGEEPNYITMVIDSGFIESDNKSITWKYEDTDGTIHGTITI